MVGITRRTEGNPVHTRLLTRDPWSAARIALTSVFVLALLLGRLPSAEALDAVVEDTTEEAAPEIVAEPAEEAEPPADQPAADDAGEDEPAEQPAPEVEPAPEPADEPAKVADEEADVEKAPAPAQDETENEDAAVTTSSDGGGGSDGGDADSGAADEPTSSSASSTSKAAGGDRVVQAAGGTIKVVADPNDAANEANEPKTVCDTFYVVGDDLTPGPSSIIIYKGPGFVPVLYASVVTVDADGRFVAGPITEFAFRGSVKIEVTHLVTNSVKSKVVRVNCAPAAVTLTKTASDTTPDVDQAFSYTITAANSGNASATNFSISDDVPEEFTVTGVTPDAECDFDPLDNSVDCTGLTVPGKGSIDIVISVEGPAAADCGKTVRNTVISPDADDAFVDVTTPACVADLTMTKANTNATPAVDESFTYTVTFTNTGYAATDVSLSDTVPDLFTVTDVDNNPECGFLLQVVTCAGLTVPAKTAAGDGELTVTITVDGPAAEDCGGPAIINTASTNGGSSVTVVPDASDTGVTPPACFSDLTMTKTNSNATPAAGDAFFYTVTFTNTGYEPATGVSLSDTVPAVFTVTDVDNDAECGFLLQVVTCANLTVPARTAAGNGELAVTITVDGPAADDCGLYVNRADSDGGSSTSGPMFATDTPGVDTPCIVFVPNPSMTLDKSADHTEAELGDVITYTYVITNTGNVSLTSITIDDDKIPGLTVDPAVILAPTEKHTMTATYTVTAADVAAGEVTNVAVTGAIPSAGGPVTATDTMTIPIGTTVVEDTAFLTVTKDVEGKHDGAGYDFTVDCGGIKLGSEAAFSLPASGGQDEIGVAIPVGTSCRVVETDSGGADSTTVAVNAANGVASRAVTATVVKGGTTVAYTNTFDAAPTVVPRDPDPRDPDPRDPADPADPADPTLPATGTNAAWQAALAFGALALGRTMVRSARRPRAGWLRD